MRALREALITEMDHHRDDLEYPVKPQKIIWDLRTALDLEDIVICDVGAHKMWMARMFRCERPNTCLISPATASINLVLNSPTGEIRMLCSDWEVKLSFEGHIV